MKVLISSFALGVLLVTGSAADAQRVSGASPPPGESGTRLGHVGQQDAAAYGMRFARCLVGFKPREAAAFLSTAPGTPASAAAYEALVPQRDNRCIQLGGVQIGGSTLQMTQRILRGNLAQALYLDRFPDSPPATGSAEQTIPVEIYNTRVTTAADTQSEIIRIFGECMAMRYTAAVDRLVRTDVESDEESAAIGTLAPNMGPCLWNGQSIQFSRESLRAALADGLYRWAMGQTGTGSPS